jgi:hypothetical protein
VPLGVRLEETLLVGVAEAQGEPEGGAERERDGDGDGEREPCGDSVLEGDTDMQPLEEGESVGCGVPEGRAVALGDAEGSAPERVGAAEAPPLALTDGVYLGVAVARDEALPHTEVLGERDGEAVARGERLAEADTEG